MANNSMTMIKTKLIVIYFIIHKVDIILQRVPSTYRL